MGNENYGHGLFLPPIALYLAWEQRKRFNVRAETVAEKPSFRKAFQQRRCLILADGFYEWKREGGESKRPYYIHFTDNRPFAFAGLWERWGKDGDPPLESCAIITTGASLLMEPIHHRMPVILNPQDYSLWLDPTVHNVQRVVSVLDPYPSHAMEAYPVGSFVNNPCNDNSQCVQPVG